MYYFLQIQNTGPTSLDLIVCLCDVDNSTFGYYTKVIQGHNNNVTITVKSRSKISIWKKDWIIHTFDYIRLYVYIDESGALFAHPTRRNAHMFYSCTHHTDTIQKQVYYFIAAPPQRTDKTKCIENVLIKGHVQVQHQQRLKKTQKSNQEQRRQQKRSDSPIISSSLVDATIPYFSPIEYDEFIELFAVRFLLVSTTIVMSRTRSTRSHHHLR
ncbi:hypothetical protein BDA99DRAFT_532343 [Phascolomyces articulosus]|uniref:Uncharacterized protein n=1 Tax=Phascolomyces articulosus TaxID=60185 RepID=A0AAD5KPC6_9FUNG|nr:hypothetical protein BDA99DRAFT_532343 [Phascolomyces articulosus]